MALLGLIGVLALVLPMAQVLRFQVEALAEDRNERARLDPLAEAVAVQRGLIGHDAVATLVLRGRTALEAERRLRQNEVDQRLMVLQATLQAGAWQTARREAGSLQADWRQLASDIEARLVDVDGSRRGHRLLLEQAVQVMDLVQASLAWPLGRADAPDLPARVEARRGELNGRIARAESSVALLATALLATVLLGLAGLAAGLRPAAAGRASAPPEDIRRGAGRRVGDRPAVAPPSDIAAAGLDAVKRGVEDERSRS